MARQIDRIVVTERDLREQVRDLAKLFGWKMYFSWTSLHSPKGFPDLVLACQVRQRVIYAELKAEKGKVSESQREWLDELAACGQEVYLWRPADFEEIARILRSRLPCEGRTTWDYIRGEELKARGQMVSDHDRYISLFSRLRKH